MDQAPQALFNPQAADARVLGVLQPELHDLPALLETWSGPTPLRVSGGGTTSRAAVSGCWSLDLSAHGRSVVWDGSTATVRIGAGSRVGEVLEALVPHQRTIAAGLSGLPGMGYVLTGGMGPLSRQFGLAVDQLTALAGVWGGGEPFRLERARHGKTDEWRGLCGAAPFLAVVTEVRAVRANMVSVVEERALVVKAKAAAAVARAEPVPASQVAGAEVERLGASQEATRTDCT